MAANKSALPTKMAVSLDFVDRAFAIESGEVLATSFLQVLAQVMLEPALVPKATFLGGKLVAEHPGSAKWKFVARATERSAGVLPAFLLFVVLLAFTTAITRIRLVVAVICSFSRIIINYCILCFRLGVSAMYQISIKS